MSKVLVCVTGKNIENYIYLMQEKHIELLNIKYIDRKTIHILIYQKNLNDIYNPLYEINILKFKGLTRIKNIIKYQKYFLLALLIGCIIFTILINTIYDIEILHTDTKLKEKISSELNKYGIKKYSFAKSYNQLEKIKNEIKKTLDGDIEWLMIKRDGTKYIVMLEPRKTNIPKDDNKLYNIVAKKDAIIKKILSFSGNVLKEVDEYVSQGDTIISSDVYLNDELKGKVNVSGMVYGETWYRVRIEYPLKYYEEKETGKSKRIYNIKMFDRYIGPSLYKNKKVYDKPLLSSSIFPISLNIQLQKEIEILDYDLNYEEAEEMALKYSRDKIEAKLLEDEYIIYENKLKSEVKDSKIVLDVFYAVYENITEYKEVQNDR